MLDTVTAKNDFSLKVDSPFPLSIYHLNAVNRRRLSAENMPKEKNFGLAGRRMLKGGSYQEIDPIKEAEKLSKNPLEHWTQAYLRFTNFEGGDHIRSAMSSVLTTTGVVAALISTLVVSALISPPLCTSDITNVRSSCSNSEALFVTYSTIHIVNLINCLATITYVTIASLWIGIHRDEEMTFFIVQYYLFAIAIPATCMSLAIVGTMAAEMIRVWIVYGPVAFGIGAGVIVVLMIPCCWFATKLVFTTVALRKAHAAYQEQSFRSSFDGGRS